ncbi:hypothetical protein [Microbacterium sp.]|uniref:hypothetical protein n=1 Tax=Microbacterium sp. TaxID=51671 RepID=UPI0033411872
MQRDIVRPVDVPRPESVAEVATWAGSEDLRTTHFIHAPVVWVLLPLAALGFLIWGSITSPNEGPSGDLFADDGIGSLWLYVAASVWLLVAIGVLIRRLVLFHGLREENEWIFQHHVAHSIHRTSFDRDDGEGSWATYIALDHRIDDRRATGICEAFEEWLRTKGLPPSGSEPISSATLFGPQLAGGYFFLHLPVSQTAGETTKHEWLLITPSHEHDESDADEVIVTPVPPRKRLQKIRARLHRKAERSAR